MANLSIAAAAKEVGVSPASVRNWLKAEASLKGKSRKGKRGVTISPAGVAELKKIAKRRRAAASPALKKAWAAKKAGFKPIGKAKKSRKKTSTRKKSTGRAGKKKASPGLQKAWAARRAKAKARREAAGAGTDFNAALSQLDTAMNQAVDAATVRAREVLVSVLEGQKALIERALAELK